jgi:hypothetical protein
MMEWSLEAAEKLISTPASKLAGDPGVCGERTVYSLGAPNRVIDLLAPRSLLGAFFRSLSTPLLRAPAQRYRASSSSALPASHLDS